MFRVLQWNISRNFMGARSRLVLHNSINYCSKCSFTDSSAQAPSASSPNTSAELDEDIDPLRALEKVAQRSLDDVKKIERDEKNASADSKDATDSSRKRRNLRRRRTVDHILGDVLNDALKLRDMGKKPSVDFIYKRTQDRLYEEEYGKKPPSAKEHAAKYIPFPPDFHLHRLLPLFSHPTEELEQAATSLVHRFAQEDPWPERAITPLNPVWTKGEVEKDKQETNGESYKKWEHRMYAPRDDYDITGEFLDASDELAHWEAELLQFLRQVPLTQRRSLPYLHEWYRLLVHRAIRSERRYICTRDAALAKAKADPSLFKRSEERVERIRSIYAEAHRSLSSVNYDPMRMKKSTLAPFMRMSDREFTEWKEMEKQRRNILVAELS